MEEKNKGKTQKIPAITITGLNKTLCRVAGSDINILNDPKCSHEISRHARIGAIIISTAVLATVSMFFAIQTISQSLFTAFVAGIIWGTAIFILDSYIIASYKKNDNKWKEFKLILPRLILALVLGCSISIPLELKFFSTEINDEIIAMKAERQTDNQIKANQEYNARIKPFIEERIKLENSNNNLRAQLETTNREIGTLNDRMSLEKVGKGLTEKEGKGVSYYDLEEQRDYIKNVKLPQINSTNTPAIEANIKEISSIDSQIASVIKPAIENVKLTGLSSQMDALKRLTSKNNYVLFAYWIFFLLILGMETAPIFVKFFSQKGSYDEIFAMNEYEIFIQQQKRKSDLHELINLELEAIHSINTRRSIAQNAINEKVMTTIAEVQGEIAEKAIRLWQLQQLKKVDENVEAFVASKIT